MTVIADCRRKRFAEGWGRFMRTIHGTQGMTHQPVEDSPFNEPAPVAPPPAPQVSWPQCDDPTCPMLAACRQQMNPPPGVQAEITLPPGSCCSRGRECLMLLRRDN